MPFFAGADIGTTTLKAGMFDGAGHDHIAGALGPGVSRPGQGLISVGTSAAFFSPMPPEAFETEDYLSLDTMSGGYSAYPGGMNALTGMNDGGRHERSDDDGRRSVERHVRKNFG